MQIIRLTAAGMSMLAGVGLAAAAPVPTRANFKLGEVRLSLDVPEGFCVPTGLDQAQADALARADERNFTAVTLLACNRSAPTRAWSNYVLVKAPVFALHTAVTKEQVFPQLIAQAEQPKDPAAESRLSESVANATEKTLGARVEVHIQYEYAGRDADCVYMIGPITGKSDLTEGTGQIASCMTVVGGRFLALHLYEFPAKSSVAALKAQVHGMAATLRP